MFRPSVSIVIPVWNEWEHTRNCLDTLRPTLGVNDEVIVVNNGSEDGTVNGLKQYDWVKIVHHEVNQGFARGCNTGAAIATKDVIIYLNNDTLLPARWIEGLTWPFEMEDVMATGPMSNAVSGPQNLPGADYALQPMSSFRDWTRNWREMNKGKTIATDRLVGFCLAVRRADIEQYGGFDEQFGIGGYEDDDLCRRLAEHGRLLICKESFVHHVGHVTFDGNGLDWFDIQTENAGKFAAKHGAVKPVDPRKPLASACMIIKDEIDNLDRCLSSLAGLVDEVIIYDTGSTDGSIEFARNAGATVIEGYWDDNFSRARNAALDACNGEWIVYIDADEMFEGDPAVWRGAMQSNQAAAFVVDIFNHADQDIHNMTHQAARVFRREVYHWVGHLHEQITTRDGSENPEMLILQPGQLIHYGYRIDAMDTKNKAERNIRLAQLGVDSGEGDRCEAVTNLGRSLAMAGRHAEAMEKYEEARAIPTDNVRIRRAMLRAGAYGAMSAGQPEKTFSWADELEANSSSTDMVRYLRGLAFTDTGRFEEAIAQLDGLLSMDDEDGMVYPLWIRHVKLAVAYAALLRWDEAADAIALAAVEEAHEEDIWALVADAHYFAGRDVTALLDRISGTRLLNVFGQLGNAQPAAADMVLEHLWTVPDKTSKCLAMAIRVAPYLEVERALAWSNRLREVSLVQHCPLIVIASNPSRTYSDRILAATTASAAFGDPRALPALRSAAESMPVDLFADVLVTINDLDTSLLEPAVEAAATSAERCYAMASVLAEFGALEEGIALMERAAERSGDSNLRDEAQAWIEQVRSILPA